ncbi:MAG: DUF4838 domain-containing protein [Abditibacteriaceae bacterium]
MKRIHKLAVLLAFGLVIQAGCAHTAPTTATPTAFTSDDHTALLLHLDGNVTDSSQWGIGSSVGGKPQWTDGRFGQALKFDGNTLVAVPGVSTLHVGDRSWTVEAWIKPDKDQPIWSYVLASGWGFGRMYGLRIYDNKYLSAEFDASNESVNSVMSPDVSATLFDGKWHEIAAVLDRSRHGEIRLYLDGKQVNGGKLAFCPPILMEEGTMGLTLGSIAPWYPTGGYKGLIDEVRISNEVRPEYAANYPIPADQIPPSAAAKVPFKYNPADSKKPLALSPESTFIAPVSVAAEGNTDNAATLLQKYLRQIYGVTTGFDIVDQDKITSLEGKSILALGDSKWADDATLAKIPQFGYRLKRKANVIVIAGSKSTGTLAGVAHFLDQYCGVRFYMPGALWISVPVGKKIVLPDIDQTDKPYVIGTDMTGVENVPGVGDWATYNQVFRKIGGSTQHNMFTMFPPSLYAEKYPQIYPILKGVRYIPKDGQDQGWNPDFNAPETLEAAKDSVKRYFEANPNDTYVAMGVMDSDNFDEGPATQAIIQRYQQKYPDLATAKVQAYSSIYWFFMNKLAAWMQINEPGKLLMGLSYSGVRGIPDFQLKPNILVITVWGIAELESDGRLKPGKDGVSEMGAWLKIASHLGNHDWLQGYGYLMSRSYTGYYSTYFKAMKAAGVKDSFQHLEAYPNWGMDGPKYYIISRLMWDPDQDVNVLWKQFCDDMYGPASAPMQKYFQEQEKLWIQLDDVEGPERKLFHWGTVFKTTDVSMAMIKEARADIDQAAALTVTPDQKARIELFYKTFHLSEMLFDIAASPTIKQSQLDDIKKYFADNIQNDPMTLYSGMRDPKFLSAIVLNGITYGKKIEQ